MADNVIITPGVGATIGADDIAGVLIQRVKNTWGPDGTANDTDVASGKPMPVQLRVSDGTAPTFGAGATAGGTLRVALASDSPGVVANGAATMANSVPVTLATDDARIGIVTETAPATDTASSGVNGRLQRIAQRITSLIALLPTALGQTTKSASLAVTIASDQALGFATTCSTDITRPADTTTYAANDCWSDSTSAPTAGGFTLTSAGRISGGSGVITDITIISSADPALLLQAELWIFDSAATNVNDNSAFALSDADAKLLVGVVPFTMASTVAGSGTNSYASVQGLMLGFTCAGSANLRYLVKVKNAYIPISGEVLTVRAKIVQTN